MQTEDFNALQAEKRELDLLIEKGVAFKTPVRSLLRVVFPKKKERTWLLRQPYLGTLDCLSREYIQMNFSEDRLREDPLTESKRLTLHNARRCARIVAICILNSKWKIRFLTPLLARYLLWRITPSRLLELTLLINAMSNVADFTNCIRLMSVSRTTAPNLIQEKPAA